MFFFCGPPPPPPAPPAPPLPPPPPAPRSSCWWLLGGIPEVIAGGTPKRRPRRHPGRRTGATPGDVQEAPREAYRRRPGKRTGGAQGDVQEASRRRPRRHPGRRTGGGFGIENIVFSLEKCRFGAHRGVLHYVLRRKRVILRKNDNFELEICVKARGGRLALQNGRPLSLI